ncbi:MAG: bacillithiol biosynthesis cysteine-adding enzyme BshC [Bacteroidetes bacterium]|nr:bacillithiol biosynthesis cysteine-adding enzyme BshC [Bacteroidota bacterium]
MKVITKIPLSELPNTPPLVVDFLNSKLEFAQSFLWNNENIKAKIEEKQNQFSQTSRDTLVDVLRHQLQDLQLSEKQSANLKILEKPTSFTITTGHQLNLFSGPVFFIYKILQVIKSCEELNDKNTNQHFVPIFWMATEDHDFLEINHFKTEKSLYQFSEKAGNAVGRITITDLDFIKQFEKEFEDSLFGKDLIALLKSTFLLGESLTQATRKLVQNLFSDYGLLMIDGDCAELKKMMIPIFQQELFDNSLMNNTASTVTQIKNNYGKVQVNPREINLFYLSETRNRIEFYNNKFHIVDTDLSFTKEEISQELHAFPEKFSPNALLRPVFQEMILPNIAYIGGNAEIAYWLELPLYFQSINLTFPLLIPRNSFQILTEKVNGKIEKLGLSIRDFFDENPKLYQKIFTENHALSSTINENEELVKSAFQSLLSQASLTDKSYEQLVLAEQTRQLKSFEKMRKRLLKAEKIKHKEKLERIENLFELIIPNEIWQERQYNFSVYYSQFGRRWIADCYKNISVDNSNLIVVAQ